MIKAEPTACTGNCPVHPTCPGLVVNRPLRDAGTWTTADAPPNAVCGRCGAVYSWHAGFLTYLDAHDD